MQNSLPPPYPLHWPDDLERNRESITGRFKQTSEYGFKNRITITIAYLRIAEVMRKLGIADGLFVVSTNIELRLDGKPRSNPGKIIDHGAAVWWLDNGELFYMANDQYERVADNMAAIAATLEAFRTIARHGGYNTMKRAFQGFTPLPAPTEPKWWQILEVAENASLEAVEQGYKRKRSKAHPDNGGDDETFYRVEVAWQEFKMIRGI